MRYLPQLFKIDTNRFSGSKKGPSLIRISRISVVFNVIKLLFPNLIDMILTHQSPAGAVATISGAMGQSQEQNSVGVPVDQIGYNRIGSLTTWVE